MRLNNGKTGLEDGRFWNAEFIIALLGYFFLYMSISLFFLLPVFLKQFNPSQSRIGLIMGLHSVVAIAIRPVVGPLIDAGGGRKFALWGLGILMAVVPLFNLVKDAGWLPVGLSVFRGLGWGVSMTATIAVCSDLSPVERIARSMGIIGVAGLVANALGPIAGEKLVAHFGWSGLFNASFLCLLAATGCLLATREMTRKEAAGGRSAREVFRGFSSVTLLVVSLMPVFHGSVRGAMIYFVAVFAGSVGISRVGPFFLSFSLAAILSRFGMGDLSDRYGRKKVILPAAAVISANLFFLSEVRSQPALVLSGFIGGLGQGLIFPALSAYLIDFLGRGNKALAISLYLSLFDVGMGLGSPFYGWLADLGGYGRMYMAAGVVLFAASLVFTLRAPAVKSRPGDGNNRKENCHV